MHASSSHGTSEPGVTAVPPASSHTRPANVSSPTRIETSGAGRRPSRGAVRADAQSASNSSFSMRCKVPYTIDPAIGSRNRSPTHAPPNVRDRCT
jgi:hypothetical protein